MSATVDPIGPAAVAMARAPFPARHSGVSAWNLFKAELLRSRRTFTWGTVAAVLVFTAHTLMLAYAAMNSGVVTARHWNGNAMAWMHFYPSGFAVPLGLLVGAMAQWREQRWRQGGTAWRGISPRRTICARLAVLSLSALVCQVALIAPVVAFALISGQGWGPWRDYLLFGMFMWIVVAGSSAWGMVAFRLLRVAAVGLAPAVGFIWSAAATVQAERTDWWILPWTWTARVPLPLLGVHGNSVLLEDGSPVWDFPLLPGFLLVSALTATGMLLAVLVGSPNPVDSGAGLLRRLVNTQGQEPSSFPRTAAAIAAEPVHMPTPAISSAASARAAAGRLERVPGKRSTLLAMSGVLPWWLWGALSALLLALLAVVRMTYRPSYSQSLLELAGVPVASAVVGITTWGCLQPAWRALMTRCSSPKLLSAVTALGGALLVPVLVASWIVCAAGSQLTRADPGVSALNGAVYAFLVTPSVAFMIAAVSLAVAMSTRVVVSIVVNIALLIDGLVIGGNEVMRPLWFVGPWGWAAVAHTSPGQWLMIVMLSLLIGSSALALAVVGSRRAAIRS